MKEKDLILLAVIGLGLWALTRPNGTNNSAGNQQLPAPNAGQKEPTKYQPVGSLQQILKLNV